MKNKIKGVIFDVDGVILDSMPSLNAMPELLLKKIGIKPEPGLAEKLFAETFDSAIEYIVKKYNLKHTPEQIYQEVMHLQEDSYINDMKVKPFVRETLEYLKQSGIPMVIATSNERHFCEGAMKKHGLYDYFKGIVTSPEIGNTKEEPDIFYSALEILDTPIENTIMFEDGVHAALTANKIGLPVIGVYDEESAHNMEEMKSLTNQYVMNLGEWLESPVAKNLEI